jgi:hypothetical protein
MTINNQNNDQSSYDPNYKVNKSDASSMMPNYPKFGLYFQGGPIIKMLPSSLNQQSTDSRDTHPYGTVLDQRGMKNANSKIFANANNLNQINNVYGLNNDIER